MKRKAKNITASIDLDLDLRTGGDEPLAIQMIDGKGGKAVPRISIAAYSGAAIRQWWSADPVVVSLAGITLPAKHNRLVILRDHDMARPLGNATAIRKTDASLELDGDCTVPGDDTEQFVEASKNGFPWRASIGCGSLKVAYIDAGKQLTANGRTFSGPLTHVVSCELREVSVVTMGADDETDSVAATDDEKDKIMKRIRASADAGKPAPASPPAVVAGETAPTAPAAPATPPASGVQAIDFTAERALRAAEETRIGAIRAIAGITPEICAQAIREGWNQDRAELAVLRASRPQAPNVHIQGQPQMTPETLLAAACMGAGIPSPDKVFKADVCEAAAKLKVRCFTDLVRAALAAEGKSLACTVRDTREFLQAAFSTASIANVVAATANKFVREGYGVVESSWREVANIRSVVDFKANTGVRLTMSTLLKALASNGEIQHGVLGDETRTIQADTKALMLSVTRKDIINDDLGVLSEAPRRLGYASARTFNTDFWAALEAAVSTNFPGAGTYKNYTTGALSLTTLAAAEALFLALKDADGNPIGLSASKLLCGTAAFTKAREIFISTNNVGGTSKDPSGNIYNGKFTPVCSSYLSAAPWYLTADTLAMPLMEAAFLNGNQEPVVETADVDFNLLGIQMRCYYDYGVAFAEGRRGAVYSTGA